MAASEIRKVIIGIDGGGRSTECLITDLKGRKLGSGLAGGSNVYFVGEQMTYQSMQSVVMKAGLSAKDDVLAVCLGISGGSRDRENHVLEEIVHQIIPQAKKVLIVNDSVNALAGAIGLKPGICVNAGTGSFGVGWDEKGNLKYANGWGPLLGDEGSGYWIGSQGLMSALRAYDRRSEPTVLLDTLLSALGVDDPYTASRLVNQNENPQALLSGLCPLVLQSAEDGDHVGLEVIRRAGMELALSAYGVAAQMGYLDSEVEIAMVGNVILSSSLLVGFFTHSISELMPKAKVMFPRYSPIIGSIILAFREIGLQPDYQRLRMNETLKKPQLNGDDDRRQHITD